ncbi:adenylate/guanylate cyclase domain-containing protein [Dasania marina]|uniref:adenylate/guanylate cyclase domain-containing protein n=1 Tax=Dasania marina TaxID=471499 RepID=UPI0030DB3497|tara:strand:+ start:162088 stop:163593 length:1506 start_codon:yes stop_codon:yes gene_type:complete
MNTLTPGHVAAANRPSKNWPATARLIITATTELYSNQYQQHGVIHSDFSKLLIAAEKLEQLSLQHEHGAIPEHQKIWHDLRNVMAALQGYVELIQEEQQVDEKSQQQLEHIDRLTLQLLEFDNKHKFPASSLYTDNTANPKLVVSGSILIVDDQRESRELIRRHLLRDQHQVLEAASGPEMLALLEHQTVDLILLDLILPEMDGHELLARLKQHQKWRAIPVIVISGNKDTERVIRCIEAGAEDFLFKPINPVLLKARISAGVERKRWLDKEQRYRHELEKSQTFIRKIFGRYVSEEIADTLLQNPDALDLGGTQCKATIMMADIRGFTTIAEQLPPQQVVRLLNNYLGAMSEIIMDHNGTVNEFIGDAILAIFGAPINREDDSDRAIQCALAMQNAMATINQQNIKEYLPAIQMGISINTGPVIAGNIGSLKRTKYGVVGHTVNQTARIEDACPAGKILISESTLIDSTAILSIGKSQTIQAKGILAAINIFQLNDAALP